MVAEAMCQHSDDTFLGDVPPLDHTVEPFATSVLADLQHT